MNMSLKLRLTLSYVLLSLFLVSSLLIVSNYFFDQKFQGYIMERQEQKNKDIVYMISNEFGENGKVPSTEVLHNIGMNALSKGLILMVSNPKGQELFCMSTVDSQMCDDMIVSMQNHMVSIYPNFEGKYVQKNYDVFKSNQKVAVVTLGYYGPFYYNDEDIHFLNVLNQIYIGIAIVFLVLAGFVGFFIANRISNPIRKVIMKTRQLEVGDYANKIHLDSKTKEINQLIYSINNLADTLKRQQSLKKRMAKDYAHEFRTPLATLLSTLEAMIDGIWEPTEARLESCREEILRLTRMISDLDKLVKIEDDNLVLHKSVFELSTAVEQTICNFLPEIRLKNIELETDLASYELFADKDKIIQVIVNLMSNAVKYTDDGGKIAVSIIPYSDKVEIIVADTGIGIEKKDLDNIFENLYRTDISRNRGTGGSGIGLSVVKAIVMAHDGNIETKSELGKGSEFIITLPREERC